MVVHPGEDNKFIDGNGMNENGMNENGMNENHSRSVDQKHRSFLTHSRTLAILPTCERTARNTK